MTLRKSLLTCLAISAPTYGMMQENEENENNFPKSQQKSLVNQEKEEIANIFKEAEDSINARFKYVVNTPSDIQQLFIKLIKGYNFLGGFFINSDVKHIFDIYLKIACDEYAVPDYMKGVNFNKYQKMISSHGYSRCFIILLCVARAFM